MIRNIRLKNFVHFYEEQLLSFDEQGGAYFFIGENESGKSCTFEAIRRCMSTSKNWGMSSCHKPEEYSFVLCKFEIAKESQDSTVSETATETVDHVLSGVVRLSNDWRKETSFGTCIKFVCSGQMLFMDLVTKTSGSWVCNTDLTSKLKTDVKQNFFICLNSADFNFDNLKEIIQECILPTVITIPPKDLTTYTNTDCEKHLKDKIDPAIVIAFPVRSIATVQWTESQRFDHDSRADSRKKVKQDLRERSEIVSWYISELRKNKILPKEKENKEAFFSLITNNKTLLFKYENNDKIVAYESKDNERPLSLEKVPEGLFEAENCSILLAIERFQTICLEEAGRGMHPQMIERMRDLVLKKVKNKVIISTSHIPTFLTEWNIPQVFFFRRLREAHNENKATFKVVSGKEIVKKGNNKVSRMVAETMFFARRVLFVEGDHDRMFIAGLKSILLDEDDMTQNCIASLYPGVEKERFHKFLNSLQIISLDGHENKRRYRDVCKVLFLEHFFLFDNDVIYSSKFKDDLELDYTLEEIQNNPTCLEKKGILVWREVKRRTSQMSSDHAICAKKIGSDSSDDREMNMEISQAKCDEYTAKKREREDIKSDVSKKQKQRFCSIEYVVINLHEETMDLFKKPTTDDISKSLQQVCEESNSPLNWKWNIEKIKKFKLFKGKKMTRENVHDVVKKILQCCCLNKKAEMSRLLKFLLEASKQEASSDIF